MINHIVIKGNLTRDPEYKDINGLSLCKIGIACTTKVRTKDGFKDEVCFIDATVWGKKATDVRDNCRKGSPVLVEGRLKEEKWMDKVTQKERSKIVLHVNDIELLRSLPQEAEEAEVLEEVQAMKLRTSVPPTGAPQRPQPRRQESSYDSDMPF